MRSKTFRYSRPALLVPPYLPSGTFPIRAIRSSWDGRTISFAFVAACMLIRSSPSPNPRQSVVWEGSARLSLPWNTPIIITKSTKPFYGPMLRVLKRFMHPLSPSPRSYGSPNEKRKIKESLLKQSNTGCKPIGTGCWSWIMLMNVHSSTYSCLLYSLAIYF